MTCEGCDRAGCPRWLRSQTPMPDFVRAAFARMLEDANANPPRPLRSVDKQIAEKHAKVGIAADRDCAAHAVNWRDLAIAGRAREAALTAEVERLTVALTTISGIRDSIVGAQKFNFSEHAYPLVAALDGAGFKGAGYEIAAANLGTLIEQRDRAERDLAAARADAANARAVATEAIDLGLSYADDAREYGFGGPAAFAALRARLASPEAKGLRAMVEAHADTVRRHYDAARLDFASLHDEARANLDAAEAALLAALGAKGDV